MPQETSPPLFLPIGSPPRNGAASARALDRLPYVLIATALAVILIATGCAIKPRRTYRKQADIYRKQAGTQSKPARNYGKSRSSGPFQAKYVRELENPEVVIKNQSAKTINLGLAGSTSCSLTIQPHSTETISIQPGSYTYNASATGVLPISGANSFDKHHQYTWVVSITTTRY